MRPRPPMLCPNASSEKNGPQVTMLCMGGGMSALSVDYIDIAWSMGIRYFDTADCYMKGQSEKIYGQWLAKYPERRKDIFLVSKDHPHAGPAQMLEMIDRRLAAIGTTYLDAFYIHGIGPGEYSEDSLNWPKSDAFKKNRRGPESIRQGQDGRFLLPRRAAAGLFELGGARRVP